MKAHAQKQSQPKQEASLQHNRLTQRPIEKQAVRGAPHANAEGRKVLQPGTPPSSSTATTGFAHDFSLIPAHSKGPVNLQAKLTVNIPGDIYEQEADRVAERVTSMSEPRLQRTCACGGGSCSTCRNEQAARERIQTKSVQANNSGERAAPPVVQEVLRSSGQPLEASTRAFMEPRFGHDFSHVRVHTDAQAAESARAVNALAYTVGRNVVFGMGQYQPETTTGKRLLAHELTHIVQQNSGMRMKGDAVIQRREMSEEELGSKEDEEASSASELEPEPEDEATGGVTIGGEQRGEEATGEEAEESEACQSLIDQPLVEVGRETGVEETEAHAQAQGGNGKKPKLKFHYWLIRTLLPWYWGAKGRARFECDFAHKDKRPRQRTHKRRNRKRRPHKDRKLIRCITKFKVRVERIVTGRQPDVTNQQTDRDFNLSDPTCLYIVQWDMRAIPDRMIITDNNTSAIIRDTGMVAGTGQQQIQGPANIHIRVVPMTAQETPIMLPRDIITTSFRFATR